DPAKGEQAERRARHREEEYERIPGPAIAFAAYVIVDDDFQAVDRVPKGDDHEERHRNRSTGAVKPFGYGLEVELRKEQQRGEEPATQQKQRHARKPL